MSVAEETLRDLTAIEILKQALNNLEDLCTMKVAAAEAFNEAVKAVAKKTGMDKAVLSSYITARVKNKLEDFEKKQEQMEFLFEGIEP